jgi:hypothetical protein
MALDPRIALMGRGVEVPDVVVRRGQRAQALRLEQEAAVAQREEEAQRMLAQDLAGAGGDFSKAATTAAGRSSKLGIALLGAGGKYAHDTALASQENAAAERNRAQTTGYNTDNRIKVATEQDTIDKAKYGAKVAGMESGDVQLDPNSKVALDFAAKKAETDKAKRLSESEAFQQAYIAKNRDLFEPGPQGDADAMRHAIGAYHEATRAPQAPQAPSAPRFIQIMNDPASSPEEKEAARASLADLKTHVLGTQRPLAVHVNAGGAGAPDDVSMIADAIVNGHQPPTTTGLYGKTAAVRAALERKGYDFTTAERDYKAVQKHLATLNGAQQERLRQAVTFTTDSLNVIDGLYNEWTQKGLNTRFKGLNKASLALAKQAGGEAGAAAQALEAQINDLASELGTVYKGGNSSTDESLRLAAENLKGDWNEATFKKAIGLIRKNLQIRSNSIATSAPQGVSPNSPYIPKGQRPSMEQQFQDSKQSQAPIVQRSKSTGAYRYSTDGGKTWQNGQPK